MPFRKEHVTPYLSLHFRQCRGQYISEPVSRKVRAELLDIPKGLSLHTLKTFVPGCISKDNFDIMLSSCPIGLLMSTAFLLQMPSNVLHVYSLPLLLQINETPQPRVCHGSRLLSGCTRVQDAAHQQPEPRSACRAPRRSALPPVQELRRDQPAPVAHA